MHEGHEKHNLGAIQGSTDKQVKRPISSEFGVGGIMKLWPIREWALILGGEGGMQEM